MKFNDPMLNAGYLATCGVREDLAAGTIGMFIRRTGVEKHGYEFYCGGERLPYIYMNDMIYKEFKL